MKEKIIQILAKIGCLHKWSVHFTSQIYFTINGIPISQLPDKTVQTLICEKCGKIKKISVGT